VILNIKQHPSSKQEKLVYQPDLVEIWIKAPAIEGKANKNLIEFLSKTLDIPKSLIKLTRGSQSKFKRVEVDLDESEVVLKLSKFSA
jgi:uncharacterized protein (TIGR00251 family)